MKQRTILSTLLLCALLQAGCGTAAQTPDAPPPPAPGDQAPPPAGPPAEARPGALPGRCGRGDVHLHAAGLEIRLGPAQRRLGAGQVNVRRGLGRAGEHGHGVGRDVHGAGAHGAVVLRVTGGIAHDAAHERAEQRRVARQDAGLPVGKGERALRDLRVHGRAAGRDELQMQCVCRACR